VLSLVKMIVSIVGKYCWIADLGENVRMRWFNSFSGTYTSHEVTTASRTSNPYSSVLVFPAISFWNIPRMGST
jgi:hypothetical protein